MSGAGDKPGPLKGWTAAVPEVATRPVALGEVLVDAHDALIKRSGLPISHETWRSIVGPRIAARTRVSAISKGVLTVRVAGVAWSTELSFLEGDLLRRLSEVGLEVKKLRFQVDSEVGGPPRRGPRFSPRGTSGAAPAQRPEELPPELLARLAQIEDPVLRASIAEAARSTLRSSQAEPSPSSGTETDPRSGQGARPPRDKRR